MMSVTYGSIACQGVKKDGGACANKAYWEYNGKYLCGVHSRGKDREALPKGPKVAPDFSEHLEEVERAAEANQDRRKKGQVRLTQMRMRKATPLYPGYINVYPNYRHANRKDGYGCPELSPMCLGPVKHGQPGVLSSLNLENFHQGNKVFPCEYDKEEDQILMTFYRTRSQMYRDPVPHRHKLFGEKKSKIPPLFSLWVDSDGEEHRCSYVESRQFYCTFYQRLAMKTEALSKLVEWLEQGYNLNICGYDAPNAEALSKEQIEKLYLSTSKPFGHELVLCTMLTVPAKSYPWIKHSTFDL